VARLVEDGPVPAIHGVVRWRLIDLVGWIHDEYGVSLDPSRLGRILKGLGYARLSARPKHHTQKSTPWRRSRETFPLRIQEIRDKLPQGTQLEICHQIPRGQRSHCRTSNLRTKSYPGSKRLNGANLIPLGFFLRVGDGSTQSRFRAGTTRTNRSLQSPRNRRSAEGDRWTGSNS
jgi:hypothetical protein